MAFENAKKVGTAPKAAGKAKAKREIIELPNIKQLAQLHLIQKAAAGAIKAIEGVMKEQVVDDVFMAKIKELGIKPESVDAVEGAATMNIQFRKRSSLSPFRLEELRAMAESAGCDVSDDDEVEAIVAALSTKGVTIHKNVKTEKLFVIDPEYASDIQTMNKVEAVLKKAGLAHVIGIQDEVVTYTVDDNLMDEVCKKRIKELIVPCATIGFKPSLSIVEPEEVARTVNELLDLDQGVGGDEKKFEEAVVKKAKSTKRSKKVAA